MELSDPTTLGILLAGPIAGSFLALAADRLPRGESILRPRSHCRGCGRTLGPRDLVPIASFALSRGRCRSCGAAIPAWFLYLEIACAGLGLIAALLAPTPALAWAGAAFLWLLPALAAADLTRFRLPDPMTLGLLLAALALSLLGGGPPLSLALWGAVAGVGSFLLVRIGYRWLRGREGLGLGDVKLMAGLGAALGPELLPTMVLLATLAALATALLHALRSGGGQLGPTRALPFGAALAAATAAIWIAQRLPV
ncbi:MAG: prepilin peptidase [Paracoccaceae bacterium]